MDTQTYLDQFRSEPLSAKSARERGIEVGTRELSPNLGALLVFLSEAIDVRAVVEAGTGSGSGLHWLLNETDAIITSIDTEPEHIRLTRESLSEEFANRVRLITGDPVEVLSRLTDGAYDLVVLRMDARDLTDAVEHAHRLLRAGGILFIANGLGDGKVPDPAQRDEFTIAIRETGRSLRADQERWGSLLLPVGDGALLALRR